MTRYFKRVFFSLLYQPGAVLFFTGLFCMLTAILKRGSLAWCLGALSALLPLALWQRLTRRPLGKNFILLRTVPLIDVGAHFFIAQRQQPGAARMDCRELQRSLLRDKSVLEHLPEGRYRAITHDGMIRVLRKSESVQFDIEPCPLYRDTLRPILKRQAGGRCKRCKARCAAWKAVERQFYLIEFHVETRAII